MHGPAISDPGAILVNECVRNDIDNSFTGPSSVTTAVSWWVF